MKNKFTIAIILIASMIAGCDPHKDGSTKSENELITRVSLSFISTDSSNKDSLYVFWDDPDGIGGNNPRLPDTIHFKTNKQYVCFAEFGEEHHGIFQDITNTIKNEGINHILCFDINSMTMPPNAGITITRADKDNNGLEIGLETMWKMNRTDIGSVKVRLKHQPGIKNGTCDPGETDVEVDFPFVITN